MNFALLTGLLAVVAVIIERLISATRADHALSQLRTEEERKKSEAYAKEVARLEQEIKNADINLQRAKRNLNPPGSGSGSDN